MHIVHNLEISGQSVQHEKHESNNRFMGAWPFLPPPSSVPEVRILPIDPALGPFNSNLGRANPNFGGFPFSQPTESTQCTSEMATCLPIEPIIPRCRLSDLKSVLRCRKSRVMQANNDCSRSPQPTRVLSLDGGRLRLWIGPVEGGNTAARSSFQAASASTR